MKFFSLRGFPSEAANGKDKKQVTLQENHSTSVVNSISERGSTTPTVTSEIPFAKQWIIALLYSGVPTIGKVHMTPTENMDAYPADTLGLRYLGS